MQSSLAENALMENTSMIRLYGSRAIAMDDCVTDPDCLFLDIGARFYSVESFVNTLSVRS